MRQVTSFATLAFGGGRAALPAGPLAQPVIPPLLRPDSRPRRAVRGEQTWRK